MFHVDIGQATLGKNNIHEWMKNIFREAEKDPLEKYWNKARTVNYYVPNSTSLNTAS